MRKKLLVGIATAGTVMLAFAALSALSGTKDDGGRTAAECKVYAPFDDSGVKFEYPSEWSVNRRPDKDTIVKLNGRTPRATDAEISVSVADNGMGITIPTFESILQDAMFSKLQDLRKSKLTKVRLGKGGKLVGYHEQLQFKMQSMPISQEYVFVPAAGKIFTFVLTTAQWERDQAQEVWRRFLDSSSAAGTTASSTDQATSNLPLASSLTSSLLSDNLKEQSGERASAEEPCGELCTTTACAIEKPHATLSLEQRVAMIMPSDAESRYSRIPWRTDLFAARAEAQAKRKPMFVWIMDGNVLGAT